MTSLRLSHTPSRSLLVALSVLLAAGVLSGGCQSKTPEEIEAAKYPAAKPLTPEEQAQVERLTGSHSPSATATPSGTSPGGSAPAGTTR